MTPEEVILRKNLVSSVHPDGRGISSAEWASFSAAVKDRAFFSANVESVRFLDTARTRVAELLSAAKNPDSDTFVSRAQVVSDIMRAARESGIARGTNLITDPGSAARANVIIDTNAGLAAGYAKAEISNSYGARLAFPAQELVRIEERLKPRDWRSTWIKHGGKLFSGRMIALKDDPIWVAISRFGVPYPPFDFNSGMGLEDVSFDEAVSLGLISDDYQPPQTSPLDNFNKSLEAEMTITRTDDPYLLKLKDVFGDQIIYNPSTKVIGWDGSVIRDTLKSYIKGELHGRKSPDVGEASPLYLSFVKSVKSNKPPHLRIPGSVLQHIKEEHIDNEHDKRSIPLTEPELGLIGHVWRKPDDIIPGDDGAVVLIKKSADGNQYHLVVFPDQNGGVNLKTFYKKNLRPGAGPTT